MAAPRLDFARVKDEASFETILRHYGIKAIGAARERRALCPFHKEKEPSCTFQMERNLFHCFGCGAGGSILDFVAKMEGCALPAAASRVAEWCGLNAPETEDAPACTRRQQDVMPPASDTEHSANRPLSFRLRLDPDHPYVRDRGISRELAQTFGVGYCTEGSMKGRICIPIHDEEGALVAYAGRWPGEPPPGEPRYKLPPGFRKSAVVYNLHRVDRAEHLVLVEGYWSVFRLHALGISAVALMGRTLSAMQEEVLACSNARVLTLLFDGDEPGRDAALELLPRLARTWFVHWALLPDETEPDTVNIEELRPLLRAA